MKWLFLCITVVVGTDAGNIGTLHGPSVSHEMAMMQQACLSPLQVQRAATSNAAKVARREHEVSRIAARRHADLVIMNADPTLVVET